MRLLRSLKVLKKISRLALSLGWCFPDYFLTVALPTSQSPKGLAERRGAWAKRTAKRLLRVLDVALEVTGTPPREGLLVSNHLGYLDILTYNAVEPTVFISKSEVASWPIFGAMAKMAGTLFIQRGVRADVARVGAQMPAVLEAGQLLAFFPEGTSTGGEFVLPFSPSLLAPAAENGWLVTPAFLSYDLPPSEGTVSNDVAYWGEMDFGPHLLNLLTKSGMNARVTFGTGSRAESDRKQLAKRLYAEVCELGGLPERQEAREASHQIA